MSFSSSTRGEISGYFFALPSISPFVMLSGYLAGFSINFMQDVLSLLSSYDAVMVGYTCRDGKKSLEMFRQGIYRIFILKRLLPSPEYTVDNFYSMFHDCTSCGIRPRISLYSWKFIARRYFHHGFERLPPVFDKKCKECTISGLYNWFCLEDSRVHVTNIIMNQTIYLYFSVKKWTPTIHIHLTNEGCICCNLLFTQHDRIVRVITDHEIYSHPTIYHLKCFFDRFAMWKYSPDLSMQQQTLLL